MPVEMYMDLEEGRLTPSPNDVVSNTKAGRGHPLVNSSRMTSREGIPIRTTTVTHMYKGYQIAYYIVH